MSETKVTKPGNKSKNRVARRQHPKGHQPKMTKEERRAKYTQKARDRRNQNRSKSRMRDTICFKCRKRGHAVIDCPEASAEEKNQARQKSSSSIICYKCGSKDHALRACKKLTPKERSSFTAKGRLDYSQIVLPFATCFICNEKGHLSSQCTKNTKGIYIEGGCCKECGSKNHLFAYCPERNKKEQPKESDESVGNVDEFLEEDINEVKKNTHICKVVSKKKRVIQF